MRRDAQSQRARIGLFSFIAALHAPVAVVGNRVREDGSQAARRFGLEGQHGACVDHAAMDDPGFLIDLEFGDKAVMRETVHGQCDHKAVAWSDALRNISSR